MSAPDTPQASVPFVYRRRVAFAETDAAGIVHFSRYFRYMEEAEHALWREAGLSIAPRNSEHGFPRVNAAFDYYRPLRFEDEIEVRIRIEHASTRTLSYKAELWRGADHVATGTMVTAYVKEAADGTLTAVPIPAGIRAALGI